jgi:hypothetical protein
MHARRDDDCMGTNLPSSRWLSTAARLVTPGSIAFLDFGQRRNDESGDCPGFASWQRMGSRAEAMDCRA